MKRVIIAVIVILAIVAASVFIIAFKNPLEGKSLVEMFYSLEDLDFETLFSDKYSENKSPVETLYELKGSTLKEATVLRILTKAANSSDYIIDAVEVPEDDSKRLNIKFKVDNRAEHRNNIDIASLDKTAILLYSVIPDMEDLCFYFFDEWSNPDYLETTFYNRFYSKDDLTERSALKDFTADVLKNAISSEEEFKKFYDDVSAITLAPEDAHPVDEKLEFIGDDNEFVTNSAIGIYMQLNEGFYDSLEKMMLESIFNDISFETYRDKIIYLSRYETHNFKNNKNGYCAFIEYEGDIVSKKILTKSEADYILKLVGSVDGE